MRENDSKDFYDREGFYADVFDADWARCQLKTRFEKLVSKHHGGDKLVTELRAR